MLSLARKPKCSSLSATGLDSRNSPASKRASKRAPRLELAVSLVALPCS